MRNCCAEAACSFAPSTNYELAWNVVKDFYEAQGEAPIQGSKDAFRLAFKRGLLADGEVWMNMVKSRALTLYTYNEKTAAEIVKAIRLEYAPAFAAFYTTMAKRASEHK